MNALQYLLMLWYQDYFHCIFHCTNYHRAHQFISAIFYVCSLQTIVVIAFQFGHSYLCIWCTLMNFTYTGQCQQIASKCVHDLYAYIAVSEHRLPPQMSGYIMHIANQSHVAVAKVFKLLPVHRAYTKRDALILGVACLAIRMCYLCILVLAPLAVCGWY